ncbi:M48 family metallopeptidase, partial [Dubosiella newyorkensis]
MKSFPICPDLKIVSSKRNKRMVLSYKEGRFFLSVPLFVDEKTIEAFLQANASWIQEKRESKVKEGDTVFLFDRSYHVCFADQSWIKDDTLFYDPQSWLSFIAHFARPRLRQEFEETRKKFGFPYVELRFGHYRSKWGSCTPMKNIIALNIKLAFVSKKAREAIYVHELTHLEEANHSKAFYERLYLRLDDYDERMKEFKNL